MLKEQTDKALQAFLKYVIQQARTNLTKGGKNASKKLYNSLGYDYDVKDKSFSASITAEEYGEYQDKGVSGVKKKYNTPFSYTNKRPPASVFDKWVVRKGIAPRNSKGQFQTRQGLNYAIANSVYMYGIKPSGFLSKPFEKGFERLPDEVIEAYGLDVESFLNMVIRNGKKTQNNG